MDRKRSSRYREKLWRLHGSDDHIRARDPYLANLRADAVIDMLGASSEEMPVPTPSFYNGKLSIA